MASTSPDPHREIPAPPVTGPPRRRPLALTAMSLALFAVVQNNSAMNVALPSAMRDLATGSGGAAWILDAYSVVFGGLLLVGGACADRWGRRRSTLLGVTAFGAVSLAAVASSETWQLIVARAALGAAAAFVMPGTLAVLVDAFERREQAGVIAVWSGVAACGVAVGPVLGGLVVELGGWRAVFLLNVPVVCAVLLLAIPSVRESRDPVRRPIDLLGATLATVALGALVLTVIELGGANGAMAAIAGGTALLAGAGAGVRLRRAPHPLIDMRLLRDGPFVGGALASLLLFLALAGSLFVLTQRLQFRLGLTPLAAGLAIGPVAVTVVLASLVSPSLARRWGARGLAAGGVAGTSLGFGVLGWPGHGVGTVVIALALVGLAFGLAAPVLATVLVSRVPEARVGAGSALNDTAQEIGFALGVAVVGAVFQSVRPPGASVGGTAEAFDRAAAVGAGIAAGAALLGGLVAWALLPQHFAEEASPAPSADLVAGPSEP